MATMFRKAMLYLGLGPDEEYDDYDGGYDDAPPATDPARRPGPPPQNSAFTPPPGAFPAPAVPEEPTAIGAVRPIPTQSRSAEPARSALQPQQPGGGGLTATPRRQVVRPLPPSVAARPHIVVASSFNQAQEVADKFKGNQPVIVNMQSADREVARRLIDFASGLCYGLNGQMEKVANQVYLLTPSNVEVTAEERRRLHERGYDA